MFTSYATVARGELRLKTSVYDNQIMLLLYNIRTATLELKVFMSPTDAHKYIQSIQDDIGS